MFELIKITKALSDKNQLRILKIFEHKNLLVYVKTEFFETSTYPVSLHLPLMSDAELSVDKKDEQLSDYSLNYETKNEYIKKSLSYMPNCLSEDKQFIEDNNHVNTDDRYIIYLSKSKNDTSFDQESLKWT
ncbi:MAG: hypothetical protein WC313_11425 [Candidatus Kapaibacterium sp.]